MAQRINSDSAVSTLPTGATSNAAQGYFSLAYPYTVLTPEWCLSVQEEICDVVSYGGQTPTVGSYGQMLIALNTTFTQSRGSFYTTNSESPAYNNFICPENTYVVRVQVLGGGGGGGACADASSDFPNGYSGGGGAAGGYVDAFVKTTPGATYSLVSGNGGLGGTYSYTPGFAGGFSSFSGPDVAIIAYGGGNPQSGFDGGGGGDVIVTGNAVSLVVEAIGGDGQQGSNYNITYTGGAGGASIYGTGGRSNVIIGNDSNTWGAGGGGAYGGTSYGGTYTQGGMGASGIIVLQY